MYEYGHINKGWNARGRNRTKERHPFCAKCGRFAKICDHFVPISQGGARLKAANLQPLCLACHNKKTAKENKGDKNGV